MALLTMATDFLSPIFFSSTPSLASCCNFFTISSTCKMFKVNKYKQKVNKKMGLKALTQPITRLTNTIFSTCKMSKVDKYKHKVNKHHLLHLQNVQS